MNPPQVYSFECGEGVFLEGCNTNDYATTRIRIRGDVPTLNKSATLSSLHDGVGVSLPSPH